MMMMMMAIFHFVLNENFHCGYYYYIRLCNYKNQKKEKKKKKL